MIHNKYCKHWLVQKDGCSWHTEWFGTLNRHTFTKTLSTPALEPSQATQVRLFKKLRGESFFAPNAEATYYTFRDFQKW